ncbi:hypothetical protein KL930_001946 [Ogataea haglerorum]|uniref:WW domain-containing protein n=1 Tax=Ogataea haglerorum TaxID=1937702 RepID=A0AAN6D8Z8_9ASCO|nr:uncharacterized protein KL911_001887 [Ogataea haglerorum]KAG7698285.1 hypothetical protein KL915_002002 [Ogataea haglerorum]KAG7699422.1 hypothetical protein KL951_001139 [Ogataea haglerorum]KAG7708506.1 hypothetical protein KL914_002232 [Ogataea haglerorum]KAG7710466.1 hypothetical protein KL950_001379 [Ogataea haglerorum]KAG7721089.1 hypothetical protein KL913_000825 [Ogataea haglerorum]
MAAKIESHVRKPSMEHTKLHRIKAMFPRLLKKTLSHSSSSTQASSPASCGSLNNDDTTESILSIDDFAEAFEELPPHWEVRYDPVLQLYYYVNTHEKISQFDSPLEVRKH